MGELETFISCIYAFRSPAIEEVKFTVSIDRCLVYHISVASDVESFLQTAGIFLGDHYF